jgi:predicted enzyme related to lactoylglutathione lyase
MDLNKLVHFEIQAEDPERAARFYRAVFGWEIREWILAGIQLKDENRYWLITTGPDTEPGINGGLVFRRGTAPEEGQPVNAFVCMVSVASVDESVEQVARAGGRIAQPRMAIRGIGWLAYCLDTEGNLFGIMEEDRNAQ